MPRPTTAGTIARSSSTDAAFVPLVLGRYLNRGLTLTELLVVLAIVGMLSSVLLPAIQQARESSRSVQCQNRLKQLGLAIHQFEAVHRVFPPSGWTTVGPGNPHGKFVGWRVLVLPFLEQSTVRTLYDDSNSWWEASNPSVGSIPLEVMICPSTPQQPAIRDLIAKPPRPSVLLSIPLARSDYEAIQGVQPSSIDPSYYHAANRYSIMHRNSMTRFAEILDGTSQTIMVTEASGRPSVYRRRIRSDHLMNDQGNGWIDSEGAFSLDGSDESGEREGCGIERGCRFGINRRNDNEPFSFHPAGIHSLFADGHIAFTHEAISLRELAALSTRAAHEMLFAPQ